MYGFEKEKAELTLLGDTIEANRRVVRWIRFWRSSPAGVPTAQSTRCSNLDAVVQRDNEQDIG